ncbi:UNVERIFIED_CONTAM: hypothetical protein NCL1_44124 [Trichonephila clavipes]
MKKIRKETGHLKIEDLIHRLVGIHTVFLDSFYMWIEALSTAHIGQKNDLEIFALHLLEKELLEPLENGGGGGNTNKLCLQYVLAFPFYKITSRSHPLHWWNSTQLKKLAQQIPSKWVKSKNRNFSITLLDPTQPYSFGGRFSQNSLLEELYSMKGTYHQIFKQMGLTVEKRKYLSITPLTTQCPLGVNFPQTYFVADLYAMKGICLSNLKTVLLKV